VPSRTDTVGPLDGMHAFGLGEFLKEILNQLLVGGGALPAPCVPLRTDTVGPHDGMHSFGSRIFKQEILGQRNAYRTLVFGCFVCGGPSP
jgi:hypothetical protein